MRDEMWIQGGHDLGLTCLHLLEGQIDNFFQSRFNIFVQFWCTSSTNSLVSPNMTVIFGIGTSPVMFHVSMKIFGHCLLISPCTHQSEFHAPTHVRTLYGKKFELE